MLPACITASCFVVCQKLGAMLWHMQLCCTTHNMARLKIRSGQGVVIMWLLQMLDQLRQSCMHNIWLTTVKVTLVLYITLCVTSCCVWIPGPWQEGIMARSHLGSLSFPSLHPPLPPPGISPLKQTYLLCQQSLSDFYKLPAAAVNTQTCCLRQSVG